MLFNFFNNWEYNHFHIRALNTINFTYDNTFFLKLDWKCGFKFFKKTSEVFFQSELKYNFVLNSNKYDLGSALNIIKKQSLLDKFLNNYPVYTLSFMNIFNDASKNYKNAQKGWKALKQDYKLQEFILCFNKINLFKKDFIGTQKLKNFLTQNVIFHYLILTIFSGINYYLLKSLFLHKNILLTNLLLFEKLLTEFSPTGFENSWLTNKHYLQINNKFTLDSIFSIAYSPLWLNWSNSKVFYKLFSVMSNSYNFSQFKKFKKNKFKSVFTKKDKKALGLKKALERSKKKIHLMGWINILSILTFYPISFLNRLLTSGMSNYKVKSLNFLYIYYLNRSQNPIFFFNSALKSVYILFYLIKYIKVNMTFFCNYKAIKLIFNKPLSLFYYLKNYSLFNFSWYSSFFNIKLFHEFITFSQINLKNLVFFNIKFKAKKKSLWYTQTRVLGLFERLYNAKISFKNFY